ncbi:hypothetical protein [Arachidicoccus soli]|uniref:Uncharacterized protein n=1 Tax=Arachidicoccus soli TaxID=2341117 RepID=A0A386HSI5_9BACT|nr:hypothetical protein [Arachidicoccus soli]AYD48234.1 hypothetical protein D6B99_11860 [Arachidicoccus soli]
MKNQSRNNLKAHIVKIVAEKEGVTERMVYLVLNGDRENQKVFDRYMIVKEEVETAIARAVKDLVPFN